MPAKKIELKKLNVKEHAKLKNKLLEVRRVGAHPIFVEITKTDTISKVLEKSDIPVSDNEVKVEGIKARGVKWHSLTLKTKAFDFSKIAVTTKVKGSN